MEEEFSLFATKNFLNNLEYDLDQQLLQKIMYELLLERMQRYTMGDSSSVTIETAEKLLKSIVFSVGVAVENSSESVGFIKCGDTTAVLKAAWSVIEREIKTGKGLLATIKKTTPEVRNRAYYDTVNELTAFFNRYDYRFFAHEIPCMIDYQLCNPVPESFEGILYINEYLRNLYIENTILQRFEPSTVSALLKSITPDYEEQLMNILEPVLTNAFGCVLLKKPVKSLDINDNDRSKLLSLLKTWQGNKDMHIVVEQLCALLTPLDDRIVQYLLTALQSLFPHIQSAVLANNLESVFLSLYSENMNVESSVHFTDNEIMNNQQLRALIHEISECRFVSDKIAIMKRDVHSLRDICEIMNVCFWGKDSIDYYHTLSITEQELLLFYIKEKHKENPEWSSETGWERQLVVYLKTLRE
ncbi:MAG: DUF6179 domain-containing protein [Bacillota bacterium]|nr:DUF6179 domain-containing protein [Bacillota bacterium]